MIIRNKNSIGLVNRPVVVNKQLTPVKSRRKARLKFSPSVVAIYAGVFMLLVAFIFIGYHSPQSSKTVANAVASDATVTDTTSVDGPVATSIAAVVAQSTSLPIATSVSSLADSTQAQSDYAQTNGTVITKPQLISSSNSRSIVSYTVVAGDTLDSIAAKFGISVTTIKWANNITSNNAAVGSTLKILPTDGVLYTVKSTDTIDSIVAKYKVDRTQMVLYNDLDVSGLVAGASIILPNGALPSSEQPGYVPTISTAYAGNGAGFGGSTWHISNGTGPCPTYAYGYCTCYAYFRRTQLGLPVGTNWGNASSWAYYASRQGFTVNRTPSVGAIMQNGGGYGHVAIVEAILPNGSLSISEMNAYVSGGGWNVVSGRTVSAGNVGQYLYIH